MRWKVLAGVVVVMADIRGIDGVAEGVMITNAVPGTVHHPVTVTTHIEVPGRMLLITVTLTPCPL